MGVIVESIDNEAKLYGVGMEYSNEGILDFILHPFSSTLNVSKDERFGIPETMLEYFTNIREGRNSRFEEFFSNLNSLLQVNGFDTIKPEDVVLHVTRFSPNRDSAQSINVYERRVRILQKEDFEDRSLCRAVYHTIVDRLIATSKIKYDALGVRVPLDASSEEFVEALSRVRAAADEREAAIRASQESQANKIASQATAQGWLPKSDLAEKKQKCLEGLPDELREYFMEMISDDKFEEPFAVVKDVVKKFVRLFLKSFEFDSDDLVGRVITRLENSKSQYIRRNDGTVDFAGVIRFCLFEALATAFNDAHYEDAKTCIECASDDGDVLNVFSVAEGSITAERLVSSIKYLL